MEKVIDRSIGRSLLQFGTHAARQALEEAERLGATVERRASGVTVVDCTDASLVLGVLLVNVCCAGRVNVELIERPLFGQPWPHIKVTSRPGMSPTLAFLCSQFAGRQFSHEQDRKKRFWMGSGPFRAWTEEPLWTHLGIETEKEPAPAIAVLEGRKIPNDETISALLAKGPQLEADGSILFITPTDSMAGRVQIVGRVCEVALHKLHELGGDPWGVVELSGVAPLPPDQPTDDGIAMGRTNDAVIYGATVEGVFSGSIDGLASILPKAVSGASTMHGKLFSEFMDAAGWDFSKVDTAIFAPAQLSFRGDSDPADVQFNGGAVDEVTLRRSFGL